MIWILVALLGYLLGSVPFSYWGGRAAAGVDLRETGSGNVGAANLLRSTTWSVAVPIMALDVGKGAAAAWAGFWVTGTTLGAAIGAVAATAGHVFPVFLRFRGGKGVATAGGAFLVAAPYAALGAMIAFLAVVWRTRFVSLGSITAAILLPILVSLTDFEPATLAAAIAVSVLVLVRHRDNLSRLFSGSERRLGHADERTRAGRS